MKFRKDESDEGHDCVDLTVLALSRERRESQPAMSRNRRATLVGLQRLVGPPTRAREWFAELREPHAIILPC